MSKPDETPPPPATAEFGHVTPGGPTHVYPQRDCMRVKKFSVGPFDNNVYVIECTGTGEALIIDGASDAARIAREVEGLQVIGIVQTHGHPDHVQALGDLVDLLKVPVYAHPGDRMPVKAQVLHGGKTLNVGEIEVEVIGTPGHTPGGLCFLARGHLFSGDTLFPGGPGNTGGNASKFSEIMKSVDRLLELPDDTRVSPGHGLDTTIGRERPYVETWRARGW
ncbi:MAG TPA: MBL fold metallo-hydrolase [Actinomycetota bacterium]|nr:MBL fold metallo-hydrolase [Actinomycetota bacterium]